MNACLTSLPPTCSVCALSLKCPNLKTWHVCFWFFNVDPLYGFVRKLGTDGYRIPSNHQNSPSSGHFMAITWYNMVWVRDKQKKHAITQELKKTWYTLFSNKPMSEHYRFRGWGHQTTWFTDRQGVIDRSGLASKWVIMGYQHSINRETKTK